MTTLIMLMIALVRRLKEPRAAAATVVAQLVSDQAKASGGTSKPKTGDSATS